MSNNDFSDYSKRFKEITKPKPKQRSPDAKKTGVRFSKSQREYNRAYLASKILEGVPITNAAEDLGISVQQAYYDMRIVRERWREMANVSIDERRSVELAKLDKLEATFWEGYRRSCEATEKKIQRRRMMAGGKEQTEMVLTQEEHVGDPRFLEGVARCIQQRAKLMGLEPDNYLVAGNIISVNDADNELQKRLEKYEGFIAIPDSTEANATVDRNDPEESLDRERTSSGETGVVLDTTGRVR